MSVMSNRISFFTDNAMLQGVDFGDSKSVFSSNYAVGALLEMRKITGIDDVNVLMSLIKTVQQGGDLDSEKTKKEIQDALDAAQKDQHDRIDAIVESQLGGLVASLAEQTAALTTASQAVMETNMGLNQLMMRFIREDNVSQFMAYAQKGLDVLYAEAGKLLYPPPTLVGSIIDTIRAVFSIPSEGAKGYLDRINERDEEGWLKPVTIPPKPGTLPSLPTDDVAPPSGSSSLNNMGSLFTLASVDPGYSITKAPNFTVTPNTGSIGQTRSAMSSAITDSGETARFEVVVTGTRFEQELDNMMATIEHVGDIKRWNYGA